MSLQQNKQVRAYKLAAEYNLSTETVIKFLISRGYNIKSHQALLNEDMIKAIKVRFEKEIKKAEKHYAKIKEFQKNQSSIKYKKQKTEVKKNHPPDLSNMPSVDKQIAQIIEINPNYLKIKIGDNSGEIHISEIGYQYINNLTWTFSKGVELKVVELKREKNSFKQFSMKSYYGNTWKNIKKNDIMSGKILNNSNPGYTFTLIANGIIGFLYLSDIHPDYQTAVSIKSSLKPNEEVILKIVDFNANERVRFLCVSLFETSPQYIQPNLTHLKKGDVHEVSIINKSDLFFVVKTKDGLIGKMEKRELPDSAFSENDIFKAIVIDIKPNIKYGTKQLQYLDKKSIDNKIIEQKETSFKCSTNPFKNPRFRINSLYDFEQSYLWASLLVEDREKLKKFFEDDERLLSNVFKHNKTLYITFDPVDAGGQWETFNHNIVPAFEGEVKNALEDISNQHYWFSSNLKQNDRFNLYNNNTNIYCIIEDGKPIIHNIKLESTKDNARSHQNAGAISLELPIQILSIYQVMPPNNDNEKILKLLIQKSWSISKILAVRNDSQLSFVEKAKEFRVFTKYLNSQLDYKEKFSRPVRVLVKKWKNLPHNLGEEGSLLECVTDTTEILFEEGKLFKIIIIDEEVENCINLAEVYEITGNSLIIYSDKRLDETNLTDKIILEEFISTRQIKTQIRNIENFFIGEYSNALVKALRSPDSLRKPVGSNVKFKNKLLSDLNDHKITNNQCEAVKLGVGTKDIMLIQGPPGTGKTTVIVEIIQQLIERGERILISGQTHISVDNVLDKLSEIPNLNLMRLGNPSSVDKKFVEFLPENQIKLFRDKLKKLNEYKSGMIQKMLRSQKIDVKDILINVGDENQRYRIVLQNELESFHRIISNFKPDKLRRLANSIVTYDGILEQFKEYWYRLLYLSQDVVFATCIGIESDRFSSNILEEQLFDTVILDEAGKANISESLVVLSKAKKAILVGDHKQLPPYLDSDRYRFFKDQIKANEIPNYSEDLLTRSLNYSLFEYLENFLDDDFKILLNEQHRMHPAISNMVSEYFYQGKVNSAKHTDNNKIPLSNSLSEEVIFIDTSRDRHPYEERYENSFRNKLEATTTIKILMKLHNSGISLSKVAVITPYFAQKKFIEELLLQITDFPKVEIATLDSFQGREVEILIINFTRSSLTDYVGFLDDARRLNVALSRASKKLIMIGNSKTLSSKKSHYDLNFNYTELFRNIIEYCKSNNKHTAFNIPRDIN